MNIITRQIHKHRVARGAHLLDQYNPGWADKINLTIFDISSAQRCIVGQLYPTYLQGLGSLRLFLHKDIYGETYGFNYDNLHKENSKIRDLLNTCWRKEVKTRQTKS